jgi:tetratricopeptide (TPR) repeat protein
MQNSCPSCGTETFPGTRFCRRCGAPVYAVGVGDAGSAGEVSPQAATMPLEGVEGRATDGLAPDNGRASADTSRVSLAEMERLLRAQHETGAHAGDPEATHLTPSAATRGDVPAADYDEELTISVPRPPHTRETTGTHAATNFDTSTNFETTTSSETSTNFDATTGFDATTDFEATRDFEATHPVAPAQFPRETHAEFRHVTRDSRAFEDEETVRIATSGHAPQPHDEGAVIETSEAQAVAERTRADASAVGASHVAASGAGVGVKPRRAWPVVVAVCAVVVFAGAGAWLVFSVMRRPAVTEVPTQTATAPVAADAKPQFDEKLAQAEALLAQGNTEGALQQLREANALDPSNTQAHRRLGELLLSSGARREAIEELRAVTRNAPDDFTAWRRLATAQFAEGEYPDAADSFRRLVALVGEQSADPNDLLSYADALRLSGHADESRAVYERLASGAAADVADAARGRLAELSRAQPTPTPTPRAGEQTGEHSSREDETTATATSPAAQPQPVPAQPTPAPTPQPTPAPPSQPARPAATSPAEHYSRGAGLWSSNRAAALEEFRAAASGGNADAHYYLGLNYVEGKNIHALKRAEVVAALQHFQLAARGQFAEQSRRYTQQLEKEFDRLRKQ